MPGEPILREGGDRDAVMINCNQLEFGLLLDFVIEGARRVGFVYPGKELINIYHYIVTTGILFRQRAQIRERHATKRVESTHVLNRIL